MTEAIQCSFGWDGRRLVGSLHVPAGDGPHPAVVMAQGSGPADRDSGGYFPPIRETFLDRGIATFAFDKPGCGESTGDWRHDGLAERAEQLVAALDLVRVDDRIDGARVGLWGHSQGGWLVQRLAGRPIELAFAIASSAPTIGVRQQISYDVEHTLRDRGHTEGDVGQALGLIDSLHAAAAEGVSYEAIVAELLEPAGGQRWYPDLPTFDDADDWDHVRRLTVEPFDPVAALAGVRCPILVVYGGLDRLLPPWRGAQESGEALARSASSDATVLVFPRGDHRIQESQTGGFVDGYLDLLGDWTSRRVAAGR